MSNNSLHVKYKKLERHLKSNNNLEINEILDEIIPLLERKFKCIENSAIKSHIENIKSQAKNPTIENIRAILADVKVESLFKRASYSLFINSTATNRIYTNSGTICQSIFYKNHILLKNTLKMDIIQSWSSFNSQSLQYNRHLKESKVPKKSKFSLKSTQVIKLEKILFEKGIGILNPDSTIFFYGRFNKDIGMVTNKNTCYVRMQCDRVSARKGYGVNVHAYPISYCELIRNFKNIGIQNIADNLEILNIG